MHGSILGNSNVHVQRCRATEFHPNRITPAELWRHIDFSRWRPRGGNSTSGFLFGDCSFGKVEIYPQIRLWRVISIHDWDIIASSFWKQAAPCWNSTSGFDFRDCVTIGISFCICLPNFVQIGPSVTHLSRWRQRHRNSTSGFVFRYFGHLGRGNLPADQISARYHRQRSRAVVRPMKESIGKREIRPPVKS